MYDYKKFWKARGKRELLDQGTRYRIQEDNILRVLKSFKFDTVLEVGAGPGRITRLLKENFDCEILATDISPDFLKQNIEVKTCLMDLVDIPLDVDFDLIIGVEVLMHIPYQHITNVIRSMKCIAKHIVTLDFNPLVKVGMEAHCFDHNYRHIYDKFEAIRMGDSVLYHWEKEHEV